MRPAAGSAPAEGGEMGVGSPFTVSSVLPQAGGLTQAPKGFYPSFPHADNESHKQIQRFLKIKVS